MMLNDTNKISETNTPIKSNKKPPTNAPTPTVFNATPPMAHAQLSTAPAPAPTPHPNLHQQPSGYNPSPSPMMKPGYYNQQPPGAPHLYHPPHPQHFQPAPPQPQYMPRPAHPLNNNNNHILHNQWDMEDINSQHILINHNMHHKCNINIINNHKRQ